MTFGASTQNRLNEIYSLPDWQLASSYGETLFLCYATLFFGTAMPLLLWVGMLGMGLRYWVEKWALLRAHRRPRQGYSVQLLKGLPGHLTAMLLVHLIVATVLFVQV